MTDINKQKFINELSRLLTFMYEEDRQLALDMYSAAFDNTDDEQGLIAKLVSPTRQAVIIARAYDAKERKLQIHAQSRAENDSFPQDGEVPGFIEAIENILPEPVYYDAPEEEGQFSLFEEGEEPAEAEEAAEDELQETETQEAEEPVFFPEAEKEPAQEEDSSKHVLFDVSDNGETAEAENAHDDEHDDHDDDEHDDDEHDDDDDRDDDDHDDEHDDDHDDDEHDDEHDDDHDDDDHDDDDRKETVIKTNVPLLILYIIFAVPLGLIGIALLLIPTVFFLALAIGSIYAGCAVLVATFSGFAVFADIMVMLGIALIILALGLLFLWLFIWFIGGAMANLIHGLTSLGRKWCCKEVSAS